MANFNVVRNNHAAVVLGDEVVYLFSGRDSEANWLNSIERLKDTRNSWEFIKIAKPIRGRMNSGVVVINEQQILVFGGWGGNKSLTDIYLFDTKTMEYEEMVKDTKVPVVPGKYPVVYDPISNKVNFCNSKDSGLYSIEIDTFNVQKTA